MYIVYIYAYIYLYISWGRKYYALILYADMNNDRISYFVFFLDNKASFFLGVFFVNDVQTFKKIRFNFRPKSCAIFFHLQGMQEQFSDFCDFQFKNSYNRLKKNSFQEHAKYYGTVYDPNLTILLYKGFEIWFETPTQELCPQAPDAYGLNPPS